MKLFVDTTITDEIKEVNSMGIICEVTINPSLDAKSGRKFEDLVKYIKKIVYRPISAEITAKDPDEMVELAKPLAVARPNIIIKIPFNKEGLMACKKMTELGIKTNVTLIFSAAQALLAAKAGATYVTPFLGRLDDIGTDGMTLIEEIVDVFDADPEIDTEIIAASVKKPIHVIGAAKRGCDIVTVPYNVIMQMLNHPLTDKGIAQFDNDWATVPKD